MHELLELGDPEAGLARERGCERARAEDARFDAAHYQADHLQLLHLWAPRGASAAADCDFVDPTPALALAFRPWWHPAAATSTNSSSSGGGGGGNTNHDHDHDDDDDDDDDEALARWSWSEVEREALERLPRRSYTPDETKGPGCVVPVDGRRQSGAWPTCEPRRSTERAADEARCAQVRRAAGGPGGRAVRLLLRPPHHARRAHRGVALDHRHALRHPQLAASALRGTRREPPGRRTQTRACARSWGVRRRCCRG
eukprot:scaffold5027_cov255-Prasinococcus_capsulatus_cf.AAC.2